MANGANVPRYKMNITCLRVHAEIEMLGRCRFKGRAEELEYCSAFEDLDGNPKGQLSNWMLAKRLPAKAFIVPMAAVVSHQPQEGSSSLTAEDDHRIFRNSTASPSSSSKSSAHSPNQSQHAENMSPNKHANGEQTEVGLSGYTKHPRLVASQSLTDVPNPAIATAQDRRNGRPFPTLSKEIEESCSNVQANSAESILTSQKPPSGYGSQSSRPYPQPFNSAWKNDEVEFTLKATKNSFNQCLRSEKHRQDVFQQYNAHGLNKSKSVVDDRLASGTGDYEIDNMAPRPHRSLANSTPSVGLKKRSSLDNDLSEPSKRQKYQPAGDMSTLPQFGQQKGSLNAQFDSTQINNDYSVAGDGCFETDSQEEGETKSIAHGESGSGDEAIIEVAERDLSSFSQVVETQPPNEYESSSITSSELPQSLKDLLTQWYRVHGRRPPSCATTMPQSLAHTRLSGKWTHTSSGVLKLTICETGLKKDELNNQYQRLLVVSNPILGPQLVRYASSAPAGAWYKIWQGLDQNGKESFEQKPSVFCARKGANTRDLSSPSLPPSPREHKRVKSRTTKGKWSAPDPYELLDQWFQEHPHEIPPCAGRLTKPGPETNSRSGQPSVWSHMRGERLEVEIRPLNTTWQDDKDRKWNIRVAWGPTFGRFIIRYHSSCGRRASWFSRWLGHRSSEPDGFEAMPTILKHPAGTDVKDFFPSTWLDFLSPPGTPSSSNVNSRPKREVHPPKRYESELFTSPATQNQRQVRKDKEDEADLEIAEDGTALLNQFLSSNTQPPSTVTAARPASTTKQPKSEPNKEHPIFQSHLQNNTILLFYPHSTDAASPPTPVRIRPLSSCNSIEKLFAQATAGLVFGEPRATIEVLSTRLGGSFKAKPRLIVEGDEQDFQDLLSDLENAECWSVDDESGEITGSCTLEIRSQRK